MQQPKRKAAANVFMEQNVQQVDDLMEDQDYDGVPVAGLPASLDVPYPSPPAAIPQQQASTGGYAGPGGGEYARDAKQARSRSISRSPVPQDGLKTSEELQLEKEPLQVRETGVWFWRRIIVPPNAYVVHTRMGRKEPVTLGLGLSFHYNPLTDAYLVVPAAMQTIGVVANCISKEKQGINVLAYVQWQISDFAVAYRRLDFSDLRDPLGIVNAQLREQAEAAIKDKIATMSVEEVLTDKEPIIEELTTRLKAVAEGRKSGREIDGSDEGLGIKIVTVQLKEAIVSSQRLWENLQAPFRYEKEKTARISYLLEQNEIRQRELENRQIAETSEAETRVAIERIKQSKETEALQLRLAEESTRFTRTQESTRQKIQLEEETTLTRRESERRLEQQALVVEQERTLAELRREQEEALERTRLDTESSARQKALEVEQALREMAEETRLAEQRLLTEQQRLERETLLKQQEAEFRRLTLEQEARLQQQALEAELARQRQQIEARLALEEESNRVRMALAEREVEIARLQQEVRNLMSERDLASRLIEQLPTLAAHMPEIHELRVLQTGNGDGAFDALPTFLAKLLAVADSMGIPLTGKGNGENP